MNITNSLLLWLIPGHYGSSYQKYVFFLQGFSQLLNSYYMLNMCYSLCTETYVFVRNSQYLESQENAKISKQKAIQIFLKAFFLMCGCICIHVCVYEHESACACVRVCAHVCTPQTTAAHRGKKLVVSEQGCWALNSNPVQEQHIYS